MRFPSLALLFFPLLKLAAAAPAAAAAAAACRTAAFILVGDSTTAPQAANGGGWGNGFRDTTLNSPSFAINSGLNGRSTATYISNGEWATALANVRRYAPSHQVFVTIQFGHNDQKLTNFEATFQANLRRMAADVVAAGGIPILVTPLSRRTYNSNGTINDKLSAWAGYTRTVASQTGTRSIDLWQASVRYLERIGEPAARRMDLAPGDATHLNTAGGKVFARMVSDLLIAAVGESVACVTRPDAVMSQQIANGVPSF